ncbi:MAG: hypothetical protein GEU80_02590 [Dehalococcoidia bacterium]|nr:hypothetical protein [Dehalococcoidia bacterium]
MERRGQSADEPVDQERLAARITQMYEDIPNGLLASEELIRERRINAYQENVEMGLPVEEAEALYAQHVAGLEQDEAELRARIEQEDS